MKAQKEHKKVIEKDQKLIENDQKWIQKYPKTCTVGELSSFLGISKRRIQQLSKVGILKKTGHGNYDLMICLQSYLKYLKRLLRRYMSLYKYCVEVYRKGKTNFRNLPFYEDLQPFPEDDFLKMFGKKEL